MTQQQKDTSFQIGIGTIIAAVIVLFVWALERYDTNRSEVLNLQGRVVSLENRLDRHRDVLDRIAETLSDLDDRIHNSISDRAPANGRPATTRGEINAIP